MYNSDAKPSNISNNVIEILVRECSKQNGTVIVFPLCVCVVYNWWEFK